MIEEQKAEKPTTDSVEHVLSHMLDTVRVNAVFGQAVERDNATVIPCSEVVAGLGMGSGSGRDQTNEQGISYGGGSGGGGGARARPIAAIVISPDGVRVEPIVDATQVVLAAITTGAFVLVWLSRLLPISRSGQRPSFKKIKRAING